MSLEELKAYELLEKQEIADLDSTGYVLRHKKTGAKVVLLANDDENKVFSIGFRTPPENSTGVPHIIEHSVLCGSREFPVKDPFVEMVKGSLNTFLNAMTYPDKTIYPVASCNDKDFHNLMHIYLDAVFYPNIYQNKKIFEQEGWHYELEDLEGELTINGVVYNEMKGAFSSPDDVLYRQIMDSLYPDTTYGVESGGDPDVIPELSYEQFLDFHSRYYHPSNSYIYLYGNMDMAEKLAFIDEHYLSNFDALLIDSSIKEQEPFTELHRVEVEYPIGDGEEEADNAYFAWNVTVGNSLDRDLYVAFQILDYVLCTAPGAPVKQALIDRGIGKDVFSQYDNGIKQPFFSIIAKGADAGKEQEFLDTVCGVLRKLVEEGINKKALLAGINYYEFRYREADFRHIPKGLMYGMQILDSWLYDETKPFIHIAANDTFARMRAWVETDYFENLVKEWLLENSHSSLVILLPKKGLAEENDAKLKKRLKETKAQMSVSQLEEIIAEAAALKEYQESEDSQENLNKLPFLTRADMKKEAIKPVNEQCTVAGKSVLFHEMFTNEIAYVKLLFKLDQIPEKYFPYIGILQSVLGLLNTEHYAYGDLFNEVNIVTGGISPGTNVYVYVKNPETYIATLEIKTKVLYQNIAKAFELMEEIIFSSDFTDTKRIYEILAEGKMRMSSQMIASGHTVAVGRALSYGSIVAAVSEQFSGLPLYRLITDLEANFDEKKEELVSALRELVKMIFRPEHLLVDLTGTRECLEMLEKPVKHLKKKLFTCEVEKKTFHPALIKKNEGFTTSGQVQYVCRAGNYVKKGLPYHGSLRVLHMMMGYEYLWTNIRVKGGAYGCMCNFGKSGDSFFVSYRDPNLGNTVDVFEKAAEAIESFDADERTMAQYIIGAIGEMDTPMNPAAKGAFSLNAYLTGQTDLHFQQERDELLATTPEDIRKLADYIRAFMSDDFFCVVGNAEKIKEEKDRFLKIESLL